jgi:hypothetical protein
MGPGGQIAKQTSWETNSKAIAATMTAALEKDHTALHAASRAAQEMRGLSVELTRKADRAAEGKPVTILDDFSSGARANITDGAREGHRGPREG